jgi:hypothetical protein
MAREFPIANGKLVTDFDANGHKILNEQGGGGGGEPPDLSGYAKKTDLDDYATKEQLSAVNETATDALGIAVLARDDIGKVYNLAYQNSEQIKNKRDKTDNTAAADSVEFTEWKFHCDNPEFQSALDGAGLDMRFTGVRDDGTVDETGEHEWMISGDPGIPGWTFYNTPNYAKYDETSFGCVAMLSNDNPDDYIEYAVSATRTKITIAKFGEPYVTPTGVKNIAIPKYEFVNAAIAGEVLTVAPYTNAQVASDGTEFTVAVGEDDGKMRDCQFTLDCTSLTIAPTITWGNNFHPRTDAGTDFACVAGTRNVYWISEYAEGEFCVAGWQETTGGNAQ